MGWASRIVLGLGILAVVLVIGAGIYYMVIRSQRSQPLEVEQYPGTQTLVDEAVQDGFNHQQYVGTADPAAAQEYAMQVERFYREAGFTCMTQTGDTYENGVRLEAIYLQSTCLMYRSHPFGFDQSVKMVIQPERTPWQYRDDNPANEVTGGGTLTGRVVIDVQRRWGSFQVLGS